MKHPNCALAHNHVITFSLLRFINDDIGVCTLSLISEVSNSSRNDLNCRETMVLLNLQ